MRITRILPAILALAAVLALLPQTSHASETSVAARASLDAAIDGLGKAASTDEVLSVARRIRRDGDTNALLHLVGKLRARRGYASARALGELASHHDARVREAVLYALADVGLRVADAMYDLRCARTDDDAAVRAAAYAALGAVGDATDVPVLLDDLASADKDVVRGAFDALRRLTGATPRCSERLWRQWWKDTQADVPARLALAWDVIEKGGDPADVADAHALVDRMAWLDLAEAGRRVAAWIDSADARVRGEAYRLAAKLGLGDQAEDVARALRFEADTEARRAGDQSAAVLGVVVAAAAAPVARAR